VLRDDQRSYVGRQSAGWEVVAQLDAPTRQGRFLGNRHTVLAVKPLRGLVGQALPLEAFVAWCEHEAHALWRRYLKVRRPFKQAS